jgi:hypothetical protein
MQISLSRSETRIMRPIFGLGAMLLPIATILILILGIGCAGPRTKMLAPQPLKRLDADARVDVYVGTIQTPHQDVAIIESDAFAYVDDPIKLKQLDQLRLKARRRGANAIQDVQILTKRVRGYMADERVPFASMKQGFYELYFMRGTAIHVDEKEPASVDELRPKDGWIVEKLPVPARLGAAAGETTPTLEVSQHP